MNKIIIEVTKTSRGFWIRIVFKTRENRYTTVYFRNDKTLNIQDDSSLDWFSKRQALSELSKYFTFYKIKTKRGFYKARIKKEALNTNIMHRNAICTRYKTLGELAQ